ncbi:VQ motif [Musa troglodytarum]|uniref:VQ motif n=1 Tax=Musa troglodytarum TaxID=320322 RepID=A0A9E7GUN6_9LILI|nr:VQ motif [Musa troglodytarum]
MEALTEKNCSAAVANSSFARWISDALPRDWDAISLASSPASIIPVAASPMPPRPLADHPALLRARSPLGTRKSRASRRRASTFISVDPADFRRTVQQVTGFRLDAGSAAGPVLRPEPFRPGGGQPYPALLPTLDSSAFAVGWTGVADPTDTNRSLVEPVMDGPATEFERFTGFPTLESWGST